MNKYQETYKKYCRIVQKCCDSSQDWAGLPSPTSPHFYASLLFTKLCTGSVSIKQLSPAPSLIGQNSHWDFGSVASLTRSIIECYLVFYYMCVDECSSEEWDARWHLMNVHDHTSRIKMFQAMGEDYESTDLAKETLLEVISNLKSNHWFQSKSEKQQTHFLKGNTALFKSQDEIVLASGGDIPTFRYKYRFLSNNTHSFPMGFYRMADHDRGRGVESEIEVQYTGICLEWTGEYLSKANAEFNKLFSNSVQTNV